MCLRLGLRRHGGVIGGGVGEPPKVRSSLYYRRLVPQTHRLSGVARKFVGGSCPGGWVAEVEAAGGIEGVFGCAGCESGGQDRILVAVLAGEVDREAPAGP